MLDLADQPTPTATQAQALTEHKAGAPPSFDLITGAEPDIFSLAEAGATSKITVFGNGNSYSIIIIRPDFTVLTGGNIYYIGIINSVVIDHTDLKTFD